MATVPTLNGMGYLADVTGSMSGISYASLAGGTDIMFYGSGMSMSPTDFSVVFKVSQLGFQTIGPALTQNNDFLSNTQAGKIQYTTPSTMELFGVSYEDLAIYQHIVYTVTLLDYNSKNQALSPMGCPPSQSGPCTIIMSREFTPILYYITPQVVYFGSEVDFFVDPKSTQNMKGPADMPFNEARVNGYSLDYEFFVSPLTVLNGGSINSVRTMVGTMLPNASASVNLNFEAGDALHYEASMTRCDYTNTTCYKAKAVSVINQISAIQGYVTGGQLVTVQGYGFNSGAINAVIDGTPCAVQSQSLTSFTCITGANANPSTGNVFVGQKGLRRKIFNTTFNMNYAQLSTYPTYNMTLALDLEAQYNYWAGHYANDYTGYFKAPATAQYRFYVACDDVCEVFLSNANMSSAIHLIYQQGSIPGYRNYITLDQSRNSVWVNLTQGDYYFMEVKHIQYGGGDYLTVSVEINDPNAVVGHQQTMKEMQRFIINQTLIRETSLLTITNPDGGNFTINIQNPLNNQLWSSAVISTKASAATMQNVLQGYYSSVFNVPISVTLQMLLSNGSVTTNVTAAAQYVYSIIVNQCVSQATTNYVNIQRVSTKSGVSFSLPRAVQLSSPPLKGSFTVTCALPDGTLATTADIDVQSQPGAIGTYIFQACPNYREKYTISNGPTFSNYVDGRDILIRFIGLNYDVPLMTLQSSIDIPLTGNNVAYYTSSPIPYNPQRIFYEPVPFEFLYTNEVTPQVIVSVGGLEAVCGSLNCGYNYITPTASITDFSLIGTTLTINGALLPLLTNLVSVSLGNQNCQVTSVSQTQIVCTVTPVAGVWQPVVIDVNGIIPVNSQTLITVPLSVTSVTPSTGMNPFGGNMIQIVGSNFPTSSTGSNMTVQFDGGSLCQVANSSSTTIFCLTTQFNTTNDPVTVTLSVNSQVDTSQQVVVGNLPAAVLSLVPSIASPVLKQVLTLNVINNVNTLIYSDLSVMLVSVSDPTYTRPLNVVNISNTNGNQFVQVMYGGAPSGNYSVVMISAVNGQFDTSAITFQAIGVITSFYPNQGSIYGGTLITIGGYNFSSVITDNPVSIGMTPCLVQTSNSTQIQCITTPVLSGLAGSDTLLVFLKTSEEGQCATNCTFLWVSDGLPTVTAISTVFNDNLGSWVLNITGSGFGTVLEDTQVLIDNTPQSIISITDSEVDVAISYMDTGVSTNIDFYLPIGTPNGASLFQSTGISLAPVLLSITPNIGSQAGTLIIANIQGLGPLSTGITLVNQAGKSVCKSITIPSYGVVQCITNSMVLTNDVISVIYSGTRQYCQGAQGACNYQTVSTMPNVTSSTIQDSNTITLTGTGFQFLTNFTAQLTFAGTNADSVTVNSDTSITAVFNNGVPIAQSAQTPILLFQNNSSPTIHWATNNSTLSNQVLATQISQSMSCSFAGGCLLEINQAGLYSSVLSNSSTITVCGQVCTISESDSTTATTGCILPAIPTVYSIDNYNVTSSNSITGTPFSSAKQMSPMVVDGILQNYWTSSASKCYFGTGFMPGYVGIISQVKYWMNPFVRSNFVNQLSFQGSMDNITYTTIFTVGQEIHVGWNYHNYPQGQELMYRFYRFYGNVANSCQVGSFAFTGVEAINDNNPTYSTCPININLPGSVPIGLTGSITYSSSLTPLLQSISPRFGSVVGGDSVTFSGQNFASDMTAYSIIIDEIPCTVTAANTTSVTCTTGKRDGLFENENVQISINGMGNVATQDLNFIYCNFWSQTTTWGGEFAPIEGDMVYIPPGLQLCVDVDSTPKLSAVLVEGSLIFPPSQDPNHMRTFDASYIMVDGGYMEVGTEDEPYTSKLTITMWGGKYDAWLPTYGNKNIAVRNGILDMHGIPRTPTWTLLNHTVNAGDLKITLNSDVDWQAGETIVIAPTDYDYTHAEEMIIASVDSSNPGFAVITLTTPLLYQHYSGIQWFSATDFIEMQAEVALLTRNVVFRGDPETSEQNEYGAHIMLCSMGDESLIGRIEYIELYHVGQAFQLGRYPIHFHMIGTVMNSYVHGNSIHNTYNRAITMHHVFYLRVTENVIYNTMGHSVFIEDAIETDNYVAYNLVMVTNPSFSLLNTDQTPTSFWVTNPDNILVGNRAAGSNCYGFWYQLPANPTGPSYDPNICPVHTPLNMFANNTAHSNGRNGFWIFPKYVPLTNPCQPMVYDSNYVANNQTDPYWQNPLVLARFQNFTSWKNQQSGAISETIGSVSFENFKVADNLISGIEVSLSTQTADGTTQINGAIVIGRSDNADATTNSTFSYGITTPRYDNFQVHNVNFYNFDVGYKSALGSCSHCFNPCTTDSDARTTTFSNLYFDPSVLSKIQFQYPFKSIFYDLDGTLTGLGPKSWATPFYQYNNQSECVVNLDMYDGIICNSSVQVRRIAFHNYAPSNFNLMPIKLLRIDGTEWNNSNSTYQQAYYNNDANYGVIPFKKDLDPVNAWAIPIVTGHKYRVHWDQGLDFTSMQFDLSPNWKPNDKGIHLVFNFTDQRQLVNVITDQTTVANMTLVNKTANQWQTGDNVIYNDTATREINVWVNGVNSSRSTVVMQGFECVGPCIAAIQTVALNSTILYWSQASSWPNNTVPKEGDDVTINEGQNFVFDLVESPLYNLVEINGQVTFLSSAPNLHLRCKYLFIRAGDLIIGSHQNPFQGQAQITLSGEMNTETIAVDNSVEAGNKNLVNTANVSFYGKPRSAFTRLLKSVQHGDTNITVGLNLDWVVGDQIGLFPTGFDLITADYAIVTGYNNATGVVTLDRPMYYAHFGASQSTGNLYNGVDMRGEVVLLTRNIRIVGNNTENWGCQIVTTDFEEANSIWRYGNTFMDNVEVYNCSQFDTLMAAVRFDGANGAWSQVSNSVIHHGLGIAVEINAASNVALINNTVFDFYKFGINIQSSTNVTLNGNLVGEIRQRNLTTLDGALDQSGGIIICAYIPGDHCYRIQAINNIVAGTYMVGYSSPGHQCNSYSSNNFYNNTAHSVLGHGVIIFRDPTDPTQTQCVEGSFFQAYKCTDAAAASHTDTSNAIFTNMTLIDSIYGASINIGQEGDSLSTLIRNTSFYGDSLSIDCDVQNKCINEPLWANNIACKDRAAIMLPDFTKDSKPALPDTPDDFPIWHPMKDASFGGSSLFSNNYFGHYIAQTTFCGGNQNLIVINPSGSDYVPRAKFTGTVFENVSADAMAYFFTPSAAWDVVDQCGDFPCTAPNNVLVEFQSSSFLGAVQPQLMSSFQIISDNVKNSGGFDGCKQMPNWNAYQCSNSMLGVLLFESRDSDNNTRMISPITVTSLNRTAVNVLNSFLDHNGQQFYNAVLRLSRWPALLQTGTNNFVYQINYTGTPPNNQRFKLIADQGAVIVRIQYTLPGAFIIKDSNGNEIPQNAFDDKLQQPGMLLGDHGGKCGENRYVGIVNILEFYITAGCNLTVAPVDAIFCAVRMNWTLNEFYGTGGTTTYVDRMAASLGIKAWNIKVVSVYEGSVVVQTQIISTPQNPLGGNSSSANILAQVQQNLTTIINSGTPVFGAPILGASISAATATSTASTQTTSPINNYPTTLPTLVTKPVNTVTQGGTPVTTVTTVPKIITAPTTTTTTPVIVTSSSGTPTVVQVTTTTTTTDNSSNSTMIAVAVVVIIFVIASAIVGFICYKKCSKGHQTIANMEQVPNVSNITSMKHSSIGFEEVYEEQYHPKSEFGNIFGREDPIKKANMAENIIEGDDEDYDENSSPSRAIPTDGEYEAHTASKLRNSDGILKLESTFGAPGSERELYLKKPFSLAQVNEEEYVEEI